MLSGHTEFLKRLNGNGHYRSLDVSDIEGTKPRKMLQRKSLSNAGAKMLHDRVIIPAGT